MPFRKATEQELNNFSTMPQENNNGGSGIINAVKTGFSNIKKGIQDTGNEIADTGVFSGVTGYGPANVNPMVQTAKVATAGIKGIIKPITEVAVATPLRIAGGAVQDVTGINVNEATSQAIQKLVQKGVDTQTAQKAIQGYENLKQSDPEAAMALSAVLDIGDIAGNVVGLGAGTAAEKAIAKQVGNVTGKALETTGKIAGKTGELAGSISKTGASLSTGLEKSTIEQILKNPDVFTKKEMQKIDRESIFNKTKTAVEKRLNDLSETGKEYQALRDSGQFAQFEENPVRKVLNKYGIELDENGKLITTAESSPLSTGDISAIENFVKQYGNQDNYSSNALLNARQGASRLADYGVEKTDVAGKIGREIRGEFDRVAKTQIKGLAELDAKFAPETKLLGNIKKVLFNKDGSLKNNAISNIANLTGKGKEQILEKMENIVPGIREDVNILKAIEDIEVAKGKKVGTYLRGATGGFVVSGGNPFVTIMTAIMTSPQIAVPIIRGFAKTKGISNKVTNGIIGKMKSGKKLAGQELAIVNQAVDNASKKVQKRAKGLKAGMSIQDVSGGKAGYDDLVSQAKKYNNGGEFYERGGNNVINELRKQNIRGKEQVSKWWDENIKTSIKEYSSYMMQHRPTRTGATADNVSQEVSDMGLPDFYEHPEWYHYGGKEYDESVNALRKIKGKPDATITIYRASPKSELRNGDWVTLSKEKAKLESISEGTPVHSFKVKASEVEFAGDDITEFGYWGKEIGDKAQGKGKKPKIGSDEDISQGASEFEKDMQSRKASIKSDLLKRKQTKERIIKEAKDAVSFEDFAKIYPKVAKDKLKRVFLKAKKQ